jgi:hypothetical protein
MDENQSIFTEPYMEILAAFIDDLVRREQAKACMERLTDFYGEALPMISAQLRANTERVAEIQRQMHARKLSDPDDRLAIEVDQVELDHLMTEGDELIALMDPAAKEWLPSLEDFHRVAESLWTWATLESYVANTFRLAFYATLVQEQRDKKPDAVLTQTHRRRIHGRVKKAYENARKRGMPGILEAFDKEMGIQIVLPREDEEALQEARRLRNRIVHDSLLFKVGREGDVSVAGTRAREGDLLSREDLDRSDHVLYRIMLGVDGAVTTALVGPGGLDEAHEQFRAYFRRLLDRTPDDSG